MTLKSSGKLEHFASGAVRDSAEGKARMELLPFDLLERVAIWYGLGAKKYGDNNWRKGQKKSHVFGSMMRHITKYALGHTDEDHLAAIIWNALCLMNVDTYYSNDPALNDMIWFENGKPNGKGSYQYIAPIEKKVGKFEQIQVLSNEHFAELADTGYAGRIMSRWSNFNNDSYAAYKNDHGQNELKHFNSQKEAIDWLLEN